MNNILDVNFNMRSVLGKKSGKTVVDNLFSKYKLKSEEESLEQTDKIDMTNIGLAMKAAVDSIFDPTSGMTEQEKKDFIDELQRKIKNGEKLTADEMQYLRMNDPITYAKLAKVQIQRQALENQLKHCKSKEEAQEIYAEAMSRVSEDDPTREETIAAYNNVYEEFKKSDEYKALPNTMEEAERENSSAVNSSSDRVLQKF